LAYIFRALVILLLVAGIAFFVVNLKGRGSSSEVTEIARTRCIKDGILMKDMSPITQDIDGGTLGFGGHATVEFRRVSLSRRGKDEPWKILVELRRPMNLMKGEVVSVVPSTR
jgi:hypothetical protein